MTSVSLNQNIARPRQNWIVNPWVDMALIIAAPILAWIWSAGVFKVAGAATVIAIFMVFNVAHHFPTFIRIYGDRDLLRRFRWSLLLGPVVPFGLMMAVVTYFIVNGFPTTYIVSLWIILRLWDPWHFLMQHYGFVRIYDRHNAAPRALASWMDYLICTAWFLFIMIAAADWFCGLLYDLQSNHGIPALMWLKPELYHAIGFGALAFAAITTVVYLGYLVWCFSNKYFISYAKLLLLVITFGIMYMTYVPNAFVQRLLPGWDFPVGFATLGMVHVSQYLAIVWTYNRGLAGKQERSRAGWFRDLFATGGLIMAAIYLVVCLVYGLMLSDSSPLFFGIWEVYRNSGFDAPLFVSMVIGTLLSLSFTSTILHYYYDGFIWKVRHKENRENLDGAATGKSADGKSADGEDVRSWWEQAAAAALARVLLKQTAYFATPILILAVLYAGRSREYTPREPLRMARYAERVAAAGKVEGSAESQGVQDLAQQAISAIQRQIRIEDRMLALRPRPLHYAYKAELVYSMSRTRYGLLQADNAGRDELRRQIQRAIELLDQASAAQGPIAYRENQQFSRNALKERRQQLQSELRLLDRGLAVARP